MQGKRLCPALAVQDGGP